MLSLLILTFAFSSDDNLSPTLSVPLLDVNSREIGTVSLTEARNGVHLRVEANGLPAGPHGIHFHSVGKCDPPGYQSAGDHFNPRKKKHGLERVSGGPHAGDLPNLIVDESGKAMLTFFSKHIRLQAGHRDSILDKDGTSLVVHATRDDQKTDPAGSSGSRIACAVIKAPEPPH